MPEEDVRQEPEDWSQGPNLAEGYREQARELARRFGVLEGVVGVALVGGLPLGQADRYSDVDLAVYLRHRTLQTWLLGVAPLPEGESLYHGVRLDLSYRDYAEDQERDWEPAERWQAATAEILYDPEGLIATLFQEKAVFPEKEREQMLAVELDAVRRLLDVVVPAWLYRGRPLAAHEILNRALEHVVRLVYLVNQRAVPADRWLVPLSFELPWLPERWQERLTEALITREPSNAEATRRRRVLSALMRECWLRVVPAAARELAPAEADQFLMLRALAAVREVSLDEFRSHYDLRALIQSPAFELVSVERRDSRAFVVFQSERLHHLVNEDLGRFLDHQQRILRALAALPT